MEPRRVAMCPGRECGQPVPIGASHCPRCGHPLPLGAETTIKRAHAASTTAGFAGGSVAEWTSGDDWTDGTQGTIDGAEGVGGLDEQVPLPSGAEAYGDRVPLGDERLAARERASGRRIELRLTSGADRAAACERARRVARLEHPAIVRVHDIGLLEDDRLYVATPLIESRSFDAACARALGLRRGLVCLLAVGRALRHAHAAGVAHGALTVDAVRVAEHDQVWLDGWLAPDADEAARAADAAGYAGLLGGLLSAVRHPAELGALASSGDVEAAIADVEAFLDGRPLRAARYTAGMRVRRWLRGHPALAAAALAALLAVLVAALHEARSGRRQRAERASRAESSYRRAAAVDVARARSVGLHLEACRALERRLRDRPDDAVARERRRELGAGLARIAGRLGDAPLARHAIAELGRFGAGEAERARLLRELQESVDAERARRRSALRAIVADVRAGLGRPGRDADAPRLTDRVLEAAGLGDAAYPLLAEVLDGLPDVPAAQARDDLSHLCALVLGQLGDARALPSLVRWMERGPRPARLVDGALAIRRIGGAEAEAALARLAARLGAERWGPVAAALETRR